MGKAQNKVAVITGANSGMGLATAKLFVEEGASVVITGRRQKELDDAVASIGRNVFAVQGDIASLPDLERLRAFVAEKFGRVDVVFANAGGGGLAPFGSVTEAEFDRTVNLKGTFDTHEHAQREDLVDHDAEIGARLARHGQPAPRAQERACRRGRTRRSSSRPQGPEKWPSGLRQWF